MGLLVYQAMPSLRDVAVDGWLRTIPIYISSWKANQLAAGQLLANVCVHLLYNSSWKINQHELGSSYQGNLYSTERAGDMDCPSV